MKMKTNKIQASHQQKIKNLKFVLLGGLFMNTKPPAPMAKTSTMPKRTLSVSTESYFDGSSIGLFGRRLLAALLTLVTLGLGFPWAKCMLIKWRVEHTVISGQRLNFTGKGGGLFLKWLLWSLLTIVTLGVYAFFIDANIEKWKAEYITARSENISRPLMKSDKVLFILIPVIMLIEIAALIILYNFALSNFEWIPEIPLINLEKFGIF